MNVPEQKSLTQSTPLNTESIKERLHLHVKRRLQGNTVDGGNGSGLVSQSDHSHSIPTTPTSSRGTTPTRSPQKTKIPRRQLSAEYRQELDNLNNNSSIDYGGNVKEGSGMVPIVAGIPGATLSTNSASSAVRFVADLDEKCNEVLTTVLNQKKLAMMQDPDVVTFLEKIYNNLYRSGSSQK